MDGDDFAISNEEIQLSFQLENTSSTPIANLRAQLSSDDPFVKITDNELALNDLGIGERGILGTQKLAFRFTDQFIDYHNALLTLEIRDRARVLAREQFSVTGFSPRRRIVEVAVIDNLGNKDGMPQAGEFIRVRLGLDISSASLPPIFEFNIRPLDEVVRVRPQSAAHSAPTDNPRLHYVSSPEFILPGTLDPGTRLLFELEISSPFASWRDTLSLILAEGEDRTPPQVGFAQVQFTKDGPLFTLPPDRLWEGSPLSRVEAVVFAPQDTSVLATVLLSWDGQVYQGLWSENRPGRYWVQIVAEDNAGNRGSGALGAFSVLEETRDGQEERFDISAGRTDGLDGWESLGPQHKAWREPLLDLAVSPNTPRIAYLLTTQGLWRSLDQLQTWEQMGLMLAETPDIPFGQIQIAVDADNPLTVYFKKSCSDMPCTPLFAKSTDGGTSWQTLPTPNQDASEDLLAVDPFQSGRLYLLSGKHLWISENGGISWNETRVTLGTPRWPPDGRVQTIIHPTDPELIYVGNFSSVEKSSLWQSADGGQSWEELEIPKWLDIVTLALDPQTPSVLHAGSADAYVYTNRNGGRGNSWRDYFFLSDGFSKSELGFDPQGRPFAWSSKGLWRFDANGFEQMVDLPFSNNINGTSAVRELVFVPQTPSLFYLLPAGPSQQLWLGEDGGRAWQPVAIARGVPPVNSLWLGPGEQIVAASGRVDIDGRNRPALFVSDDRGRTWKERSIQIPVRDAIFDALHHDAKAPEFALAYTNGSFYWSTDGGSIWRNIIPEADRPKRHANIRPALLSDQHQPGVYYIANRSLYYSEDFGATWEERTSGLPPDGGNAFALAPDRFGVLYAVVGDKLWRSNSGLGWEIAETIAPGELLLHLAINPQDGRVMYAASRRKLYRSIDGGFTWQTVLEAGITLWERPDMHFTSSNSELIYFVTGRQLFQSTDRGESWRPLNPEVIGWPWINDLVASPDNPAIVYVATAQGVYRINIEAANTVVSEGNGVPKYFSLAQNYPNPFNDQTSISFSLPQKKKVKLSIYNITGQEVAMLIDEVKEAGLHTIIWNGKDASGIVLASGVYFYRLRSSERTTARKLLLLQ